MQFERTKRELADQYREVLNTSVEDAKEEATKTALNDAVDAPKMATENQRLITEVKRLEGLLEATQDELEDCERLMNHTRAKFLNAATPCRSSSSSGAAAAGAATEGGAGGSSSGTSVENLKAVAALTNKLHAAESKKLELESRTKELELQVSDYQCEIKDAQSKKKNEVQAIKDEFSNYKESTEKTTSTGSTQTVDTWWNDVQKLHDNTIAKLSGELRDEISKSEALRHDA